MTVAQQLRAARDHIADPERWCQGAGAKNKSNIQVEPCNPLAVRWCARGACMATCTQHAELIPYLHRAALSMGHRDIFSVNDRADHATVMKMFDLAIQKAEGK